MNEDAGVLVRETGADDGATGSGSELREMLVPVGFETGGFAERAGAQEMSEECSFFGSSRWMTGGGGAGAGLLATAGASAERFTPQYPGCGCENSIST